MLLAAGCHDSPAAPPAGLDARLSVEPVVGSVAPVTNDVAAFRDSIVATAHLGLECLDYRASAGEMDGFVVVTLVAAEGDFMCAGWVEDANFRIVVRPVPRGSHEVRFLLRHVDRDGNPVRTLGLARMLFQVR
jgi:hypothetical protein